MDISTLYFFIPTHSTVGGGEQNPQDELAFSQRMLANHLSQDHDWASCRQEIIERQVEDRQPAIPWRTYSRPRLRSRLLYPPLSRSRISLHRRGFLTGIRELGPSTGAERRIEYRLCSTGCPRILAG